MNNKLTITSSPHINDRTSVKDIMWSVILALVPATIASVYYFGLRAILIITVSITGAVITEYLFLKARGKRIVINDGSSVLTGLLLALILPPGLPLWAVFVGAVFAIAIGKQIFGGLGHNSFNPALVGRAFLIAAYPVMMTTFDIDGQTMATPLNLMETGIITDYWDLFIGNTAGSLGETSAFALLIGASYLIYKGYISWRIPTGMLASVFLFTMFVGQDPVFHLFAGGLIIGAFYMATDYVTTPVTKKGRWIFGIGAGIIVVVIRLWGGYPEGVMYGILLMNTAVPLIDRYTRPKSLGEVS